MPKSAKAAKPPSQNSFDQELAELDAYKGKDLDAAAIEHLRKALTHRNNFLVAKAAKLVADAELFDLLPDVLAGFERFFVDPVKSDPQCWAKNALAKALVKLEHRQRDAYLRGMRHHQMEPVWGGVSDSAGTLRATCAHALVDCPGMSDADILMHLTGLLVDPDKAVRMEAVRAIAQVGGVSAALLLRLRALLGPVSPDRDTPEVLGAVYSGLLSLDGERAIDLVTANMKDENDAAAEAAFALADLRSPKALAALVDRFNAGADPWFTSVLLSAIAITRLPEAFDFLLAMVAAESNYAAPAIEAIARTAPTPELCVLLKAAVAQSGSPRLEHALHQQLPD
jgi:HEAT repeat protein